MVAKELKLPSLMMISELSMTISLLKVVAILNLASLSAGISFVLTPTIATR